MTKMTKRVFVTLCAASMLASVGLSSCSGDSGSSTASTGSDTTASTGTSESSESEEPTTIRIFNRLNAEVAVEDNPLLAEIENRLNLVIEYEAPPINNYNERLQITMASGDLPDIIYNWGGADSNYEQWAADGLLAELDDYIPNYENIVANVPESMMEAMRSTNTGKIHAIAKPNMVNYWGMVINQQWLDNLDLEVPTTLDEFKEVMHAFTYDDPDGNGVDDTYGFSTAVTGTAVDIPYISNAFGLGDVVDKDGNPSTRYCRTEYIDYLEFLRECYLDGSFDPEYFTNAYMADAEKLRAQTIGAYSSFQTGVHQQLAYMDEETCLSTFTYAAPLENVYTGKPTVYSAPPIWGCWMISADADVEKCLELIDWGNGDEGFVLMNLGIEGVDYESYDAEAHSVVRTTEQAETLKTYSSSYFTFAFAKDGFPAIYENVDNEARVEKFNKDFDAVLAVTELIETPTIKSNLVNNFDADNPDLITERSEMETAFVVGEIDRAAFEDFINNTYIPAAAAMEEEYAAAYEALGE
ncbi:MAG TPA: extracellular solute-binding protein [Candidatus Merdivicinus faecavium]|nr:extracellular solute-binding protein [Candidatus Merdivicinus faecavium]